MKPSFNKKTALATTVAAITAVMFLSHPQIAMARPALPDWQFGASPTAQDMHTDQRAATSGTIGNAAGYATLQNRYQVQGQDRVHHLQAPVATDSPYNEGDFVGTLTVERLDRTVRIFEGESMHNMDFGAGRFTFSGLNSGNMGLIGHNRGPAGYFSFVRLLRHGDIITIETAAGTRSYAIEMTYIINERDFSPLLEFGDNRLTLVTCVEYQPTQRRVAVGLRVDY